MDAVVPASASDGADGQGLLDSNIIYCYLFIGRNLKLYTKNYKFVIKTDHIYNFNIYQNSEE